MLKTKWLETIQKLSNQDGAFTKEWQFHYWFASCRKEVDGQTLDIAIPMCFYNYDQQVTGAHIDFELPDVTKAKDNSYQDALIKFEEFTKTDLFAILSNLFGNQWSLYGYSNIHTHPNGIYSFSSTDLNKSNTNPGVVFPLATGSEIPHFTGIQMHVDGKCELVHNEFRVFNRKDDVKLYEHGRCLTICEGFEEPYKEPEPKKETEIDEIFGQKRWQPIAKKKPKVRRNQFIINNLEESSNLGSLSKELLKLLKNSDFEPAYNIDAKNIRPKVYKQTKVYPYGSRNNSLFSDDDYFEMSKYNRTAYTPAKTNIKKEQKKYFYADRPKKIKDMITDMSKYLNEPDYDYGDFISWTDEEIENEYDIFKDEIELRKTIENKDEDEKIMVEYLLDNGMEPDELITYSKSELEKITEEFIRAFDSDDISEYDAAIIDAENFIIDNNIMSQQEVDFLDDTEILAAYAKLKGEIA